LEDPLHRHRGDLLFNPRYIFKLAAIEFAWQQPTDQSSSQPSDQLTVLGTKDGFAASQWTSQMVANACFGSHIVTTRFLCAVFVFVMLLCKAYPKSRLFSSSI
jgi:hypothetical protein